ncbi:MAG: peptidase [Thaumarchaeota archaeon]|nr:peptidase [Nitrososphaerota archaeon]
MLAIASTLDIWKREIHDILWIVFGVIAVILIVFSPEPLEVIKTTGISLIIAPLAIVVWRIGIFGGADAFGLIVLAALSPLMSLSGNVVTPFTTLTNAAILSITPIFVNVIRNLISISKHENIFEGFEETKLKKTIAMFFGYRARKPKYSFPIERKEKNSKKFDFSLKHAENAQFCDTLNTWVTPGIPYMVYITAGFVVQLLFGDIIFNVIGNIKGT